VHWSPFSVGFNQFLLLPRKNFILFTKKSVSRFSDIYTNLAAIRSSMASRVILSASETREKLRTAHISLLESTLDVDSFLTSLNCLDLSARQSALAANSAIVSTLIFRTDFSPKFPRLLARAFGKLIQNPSEIVRRSCLTIISLFSGHAQFSQFMAQLSNSFPDWTPQGQEMILSFVFSFGAKTAKEWAVLLPHIPVARASPDELLASVADEFVAYLSQFVSEPPSEEEEACADACPPAQQQLRHSIDFKRLTSPDVSECGRAAPEPAAPEPPRRAPAKKGPKKAVAVSALVPQMRDPDWEKQQAAIDAFAECLAANPTQLAPSCRDIWLNLVELAGSPRTTLSHSALQFAVAFFRQFAQALAPVTPQFMVAALNLACSSHQFIADAAAAVLLAIAESAPRARIWAGLMAGARHKNPVARTRALQCAATVLEQGPLDDKDMAALVAAAAPLLRDPKGECRDAARRALKKVAADDRFASIAQAVMPGQLDFTGMKRMLETASA
jgi:hypothetical protein